MQRTTTDDDERRPATRFNGGTVRLDGGDGAPVVFGGCEGADGVPLLRAHPTAATDGSGTMLSAARRDRRIAGDDGGESKAAAALRATGELGSWGKRKRTTRGCYL